MKWNACETALFEIRLPQFLGREEILAEAKRRYPEWDFAYWTEVVQPDMESHWPPGWPPGMPLCPPVVHEGGSCTHTVIGWKPLAKP